MQTKKAKLVSCLVVICIFGAIGAILLGVLHAASQQSEREAEQGTVNACAKILSDSSASGGAAVKLGDCTSSIINPNDPTNLDASGTTIPDTDYPIPAGAIFMATTGSDSNSGSQSSPVKTLNKAISLVPDGGTIVVRGGTYRDWYNSGGNSAITTKNFTLQAYPHEQVWFDGTDVIPTSNWTSDGQGHWYMAWSTPQFCSGHYYDFPYNNQSKAPSNLTGASGKTYSDNTGPCSHWDMYGNTEANYPAAGDPQMVFVDGQRMAEVDQLSLATGGKFYYDWATRKIYISTNPSGHTVELASRPDAIIFGGSAGPSAIKGIGFRRYASNEYSNTTVAAIYVGGSSPMTIEHDVFTQNAATGLSVNTAGSVVNSSIFAFNGFNGAGYYGHDHSTKQTDNFLLENSVFNNNNIENYGLNCSLSCAAAGIKMSAVLGYTITNNIFENMQGNRGAAAWCDTDCFNGKFIGNLVKNNQLQYGYHYEQDDGGIIAGNVFVNCGSAGINVSATNTKIWNNTVINSGVKDPSNAIEIRVYDDTRPLVVSNISIGNNVVYHTLTSGNVDYFGGGTSSTQSPATSWFTTLDYNSYWRPSSSTILYRFIGASDIHYNSSTALNAAFSSWAAHDQDIVGGSDPFFTNLAGGDYTIRSDSPAYHSGGPIPADVASALGVSTASGQTRGAFNWPGK